MAAREYRRVLAVGDIHGNFARLASLWQKVPYDQEKDFLVFLGDYVDRGPENLRSLDWVRQMAAKPNAMALRGNHEQMMLAALTMDEKGWGDLWRPNGGEKTYQELSRRAQDDPRAIRSVLEFVEEAPLSYQLTVSGKTFFFCHAGVRPGVPMAEQKMADLLWIRNDYYEHYHGDTIVVTGHTPTPCVDGGFKPIMWDDHIMLDTGSYLPGGHITCMDVLTREYWQSDED